MATKPKTKRKVGTPTKRKVSKTKVREGFKSLISTKRDAKRKANAKRGVKLPYQDSGADYLDTQVSEALTLPAITKHEVRTSPHTVKVDLRKVVRHKTDNLWKRPDLTLNARLIKVAEMVAEVRKLGYLRVLVNSADNPAINPDNPEAYLVYLYRKTK